MKTHFISVALLMATSLSAQNIITKGGAIRCAVKGDVNGKEMVYISEENGNISLNDLKGKQIWEVKSDDPAVMFEIISTDINGDKSDDVLAVSGNGSVYAFSSKGNLIWKWSTPEISRLSDIATIGKGKNMKIFAAGNNFKLYELDVKGKLVSETPIKGTARMLASGDFIQKGKESLFVHTYAHDKYNSEFFGIIDPTTKEVLKKGDISKLTGGSQMLNDYEVADVNGDGKDDLLLFTSGKTGSITAIDGNLQKIFKFSGSKDAQRYAAAKGVSMLPAKQQIVMQYGGVTYVVSPKGKLISRTGEPHKGVIFNELVWLPKAETMLGAGQTGGDNTLYAFDTKKSKWANTTHNFEGLAKEVSDNMSTLYKQALDFKLPSYQTKKDKPFTVLGLKSNFLTSDVKKLKGGEVLLVSETEGFGESTPRTEIIKAIGKDGDKRDRRKKYVNSADEIVAWAAAQEKSGKPFQLWVGHGTDPFYIQINTLERIIEAAPTTCYGLLYAEMHNTADPRVGYWVDNYMPRIAAAIRKHNAPTKLYFRYKNMFWAADAHEHIWQKVFFSGEYSDIIVPSAEDTNSRLQDINLAGRVGMLKSGYIDDFAMRLVDDNPTSWRPLSQGGQRSVSPYLRTAVLTAAYGSHHGVLFDIKYLEEPSYNVFFALVKSGVLPMVKPEEILSVGSWHLVKDVDHKYLAKVNDTGHNLTMYKEDDNNAIIGKAGVHWCGATIEDYDYSKAASGANYRWLNFIPEFPNGMVPITSVDYQDELKAKGENYFVTDIKSGYQGNKKVAAKDFAPTMNSAIEQGAKKMLMRVDGAAWALIKVGEKHARLILIDNGYINPEKRTATITLQGIKPIGAKDILTNKNIAIKGDKLDIEIPAGSVRFIDFEYKDSNFFK